MPAHEHGEDSGGDHDTQEPASRSAFRTGALFDQGSLSGCRPATTLAVTGGNRASRATLANDFLAVSCTDFNRMVSVHRKARITLCKTNPWATTTNCSCSRVGLRGMVAHE